MMVCVYAIKFIFALFILGGQRGGESEIFLHG